MSDGHPVTFGVFGSDKLLLSRRMIALRKVAHARVRRRLLTGGAFILLLSIVCLPTARRPQIEAPRPFDGRLSEITLYRPPGRAEDYKLFGVAADYLRRWQQNRKIADARIAGAALLFAGRSNDATALF